MHSTDRRTDRPAEQRIQRRLTAVALATGALAGWAGLMSGCAHLGGTSSPPPQGGAGSPGGKEASRPTVKPGGAASSSGASREPMLGPPATPRSWADARQQAARRLVAANPDITHTGRPQDILLAVPVITVELHADGSIKRLDVMRYPKQARDTVDIAMKAIRRAAPFGDVSRLPKPWQFNETFLFNDDRRFKPMTLDR